MMQFDPLASAFAPTEDDRLPDLWDASRRWVRLLAGFNAAGVVIFLFGSHFFGVVGNFTSSLPSHWSTCLADDGMTMRWGCVLLYHAYEVPLILVMAFHAWYGLRRFSWRAVPGYFYLTFLQTLLIFLLTTFDARVLLGLLEDGAHFMEILVLTVGWSLLMGITLLSIYVLVFRLLPVFLLWRGQPEPHV